MIEGGNAVSGTASMSTEQFREFAGVVLRSLPDDLPPAVAQRWIGNGAELRKVLRETLYPNVPTPTFLRDMAKEGWTLVEDVEGDPLSADNLELVSFLRRREDHVSGETMRERAKKEKANLGQRQAEWLLEHQEEIPSDWQNYYLVFPGTVWQASGDDLGVPGLCWHGDGWYLSFGWLEDDWRFNDRLVRPSK